MSKSYISINTNFEIQSGFAFPSTAFVESGIPIVRMSDLKNGNLIFNNTKYVKDFWLKTASPFILKTGDYLMGMSGSLTNYAIVTNKDLPALLNQRVGRLKSKGSKENYQYICYWLQSERYARYAEIQGEGAAQKNISSKQIEQFKYRKTNTLEQQKIATILQTIDQTIKKTKALIEKYQQIKAGLMQDLFTRGITADGKLRPPREQAPALYQETPIGWIPKDWQVKKIGELFHIQLGKMLSKVAKTGKGSAFYLGNKNVQWDRVNIDNLESMDFSPSERKKFNLVYGDLLVCEGGDVGRTAFWRDELINCFYQKAVHRLRPLNNKVAPKLMLRYLKHAKATGVFNNYTSQTSIAHLTQEKLSSINMFVPSESEQQKMIKRFDLVDRRINKEVELLIKLKKQKQGLMQDLLTGKVPVKVDSPEASHEK